MFRTIPTDLLAWLLTGAHSLAEINIEHDRAHGPMSQDEQGGCVWCGHDGYNGVENHNPDCPWTQGHALLSEQSLVGDIEKLERMVRERQISADWATKALNEACRVRSEEIVRLHANDPIGIEDILELNYPGTTTHNDRGYDALKTLIWKALYPAGFIDGGGHYGNTNQRCLTIGLNHGDSDEKVGRLAQLIEAVIPFIKPNMSEEERGIAIREQSLCRDGIYFLVENNGSWSVRDVMHDFGGPEIQGDLRRCLKYIRENLYHEGPLREEVW